MNMPSVKLVAQEFDRELLAEIFDLSGNWQASCDFVEDLVQSFAAKCEQFAIALNEAIDKGDRIAIVRAAHKLRGSALTLGLSGFATAVGDLEDAAKNTPGIPKDLCELIISVAMPQAREILHHEWEALKSRTRPQGV